MAEIEYKLGDLGHWRGEKRRPYRQVFCDKKGFRVCPSWQAEAFGGVYPGIYQNQRENLTMYHNHNKNFELNSMLVKKSVNLPPIAWADKPVIMIGAGPSLKKNIHHLADLEPGKAIVIAMNSALPEVLKYYKPDFFFTSDWKGDESWIRNVDIRNIPAIFSLTAANWLAKLDWKARTFFRQNMKGQINNKAKLRFPQMLALGAGRHTAYQAAHMAYLMGGNPLVFVGCDYSWEKNDKQEIHYKKQETDRKREDGELIDVQDNQGNPLATDGSYLTMALYMIAQASLLHPNFLGDRGGCVEFQNATEGGILHEPGVIIQRKFKGLINSINTGRDVRVLTKPVKTN